MVVDVCKRLAVCEARMSQALSLQAKFVKDFETVKDSAIPGVFDNLLRSDLTYIIRNRPLDKVIGHRTCT